MGAGYRIILRGSWMCLSIAWKLLNIISKHSIKANTITALFISLFIYHLSLSTSISIHYLLIYLFAPLPSDCPHHVCHSLPGFQCRLLIDWTALDIVISICWIGECVNLRIPDSMAIQLLQFCVLWLSLDAIIMQGSTLSYFGRNWKCP